AEGEAPRLDREGSRRQPQQGDAGQPPSRRVYGREQQRQALAVGGEWSPVAAGRAEMRRQRSRRVLEVVLPSQVVAKVEVVLPPEALGHQQVMGLVPRDAETAGVPEPGREVERRREGEQ